MPSMLTMATSMGSAAPYLASLVAIAAAAGIVKVFGLHARLLRLYAHPPSVEERITRLVACAAADRYGAGWLERAGRSDPPLRAIAALYAQGADSAGLRSAWAAQTESWLDQRARRLPIIRRVTLLAYGLAMGGIAAGLAVAVGAASGRWSAPEGVATVALAGVMLGFPALGVCRALLDDHADQTAARLFDRELMATAFAAMIEHADSREVERRLRALLPAHTRAPVSRVA